MNRRLLSHPLRAIFSRPLSTTRICRADPWVLPNTPEHIAQTTASPSEVRLVDAFPPLPRPNESVENTRARLLYQVRKRGTLETDLLLSTFATKEKLAGMDEGQLGEFDKLLDELDWDIYYWSTGKRSPPERWANSAILSELQTHAKNEGKAVRRMPDL